MMLSPLRLATIGRVWVSTGKVRLRNTIVETHMLDVLFAIGEALSILTLLVGAYLSIAEAIDTAKSSDEVGRLRE